MIRFSQHGSVYILGSTNLALGKPAWQNSIWGGRDASKAVDGNTDRNAQHGSCANTLRDSNPWWIVDLQSEYEIERIVITDRTDRSGNYVS